MKAAVASLLWLLFSVAGMGQEGLLIREGDTIAVSCAEEASFNSEHKVAVDGTIRLPAIGPIFVSGLKESSAADRLTSAVRARGWSKASIVVRLIAPAQDPVSYSGAVEAGGSVAFRPGLRLSDVLRSAKPTRSADLAKVNITGRSGGIRVIDASESASAEDPVLNPGDSVFVPLITQAIEVYLLGALIEPGSVTFVRGMTAKAAVEASGGPSRQANLSRARLVKTNGEAWPLDLGPFGRDIDLEPGDKIYVPLVDRLRFVSVVGAVANPGVIDYSPSMTLESAILSAGGRLPEASERGFRVRRVALAKDALPNSIQPFDIIEVPYDRPSANLFAKVARNLIGILLVLGR
ncbi:MAG: SLBB domain-containing protein [Fimbriimonadaceae bacterium]